jgi:hypothetical protein
MPREKAATIAKMSLLRPVLASIELARKARMAKIQGLKPAKRPAAKTVAADDMERPSRAFSVAPLEHAGEVIVVFVELSLARVNDTIVTSITINKIALTQNRNACILVSLD